MAEVPTINATDEEIGQLLREAKTIAVVGVSRDPTKDSHLVAQYLRQHYRTYFVNPNADEIAGEKCYPSLKALPEVPDIVDVFRPPNAVPPVVDEAIAVGAKAIWLQLGIVHNEAAQRAKEAGLTVVQDRCIKIEHQRLKQLGKL